MSISPNPMIILRLFNHGALCGDEIGNVHYLSTEDILDYRPEIWSHRLHIIRIERDPKIPLSALKRQVIEGYGIDCLFLSDRLLWIIGHEPVPYEDIL